jgi:hypothetical protein
LRGGEKGVGSRNRLTQRQLMPPLGQAVEFCVNAAIAG